ncbi:FAD-binding domain-containing protein [Irpex rosettiformis]|uniref:FAD-binding domain-containing protein n=1 Tax=Irpex rosettiformis TaxID=378272 RepID=A0ACB8UF77_9APHY|nr:FAD-binding domain-containing protein [Irpex rosettiformis]
MAANILTIFPKEQILTVEDGQAYEDIIKRWADNATKRAQFVVLPRSAQDVSKAILFAINNGLELAIRGGGHSASGSSSSEGLVIDLSKMRTVAVDAEKSLIRVDGGALWEDVDKEAAKYGLATVGGTVNHTGVGGLTVGGGYGWLTSKYGLVIDNLLEAEVVLANGDIVTCNDNEYADLFWAIRGAGSNFGPVTRFTFRGYPQRNTIWSGLLVFAPSQLTELSNAVESWRQTAGEDENGMLIVASPPPNGQPALVFVPFYNGSLQEGKEKFKAVYDVGPVADMTQEMPYELINSIMNPMTSHGDRKLFKVAVIADVNPNLVSHLFEEYTKLTTEHPDAAQSALIIELHGYRKVVTVPTTATAFSNRGSWYVINLFLRWKEATADKKMYEWATALSDHVKSMQGPTVGKARGYSNYGIGDERSRDIFGENYDRLSELKAKYDPQNVFRKWYPITPKA